MNTVLTHITYDLMMTKKRQINFKGHKPSVEDTRLGVCVICGKHYPGELKHPTTIHHMEYIEGQPLAETIELCTSCHMSLHRRARDVKTGPINSGFIF